MSMRTKLIIMNFLQFFAWGSWMMTLAHYGFVEKQWNGAEFGLVFSTMGFASLVMPTLFGILADKWKANYVFSLLHLFFALSMLGLPFIDSPIPFFWVLLVAMSFYMPTIGLNNSIGFLILKREGKDPTTYFPPIRVWGTVGFIGAMWLTNFFTKDWGAGQSIKVSFIISAISAMILAIFTFIALPSFKKTKITKTTNEKKTLNSEIRLRSICYFSN